MVEILYFGEKWVLIDFINKSTFPGYRELYPKQKMFIKKENITKNVEIGYIKLISEAI
jgi:hypothetical protein